MKRKEEKRKKRKKEKRERESLQAMHPLQLIPAGAGNESTPHRTRIRTINLAGDTRS